MKAEKCTLGADFADCHAGEVIFYPELENTMQGVGEGRFCYARSEN